jgi:hypothetical protein
MKSIFLLNSLPNTGRYKCDKQFVVKPNGLKKRLKYKTTTDSMAPNCIATVNSFYKIIALDTHYR